MAHFTSNAQVLKHSLNGIILTVAMLSSLSLFSQQYTSKNKKAIEYYKLGDNFRVRRQYKQAIQYFELAIKKDSKFAEPNYILGLLYSELKYLPEAINYLTAAIPLYDDTKRPSIIYLELAQNHFTLGQYGDAHYYVKKFIESPKKPPNRLIEAEKLLRDLDFMKVNQDPRYEISPEMVPAPINQMPMQYFPALTADQKSLIFTARTKYNDEDLMISNWNEEKNEWETPISLSENINTYANEGTCTVTADGRTIIFTACQTTGGFGSCDLYITKKKGQEWSVPQNLGPVVNSSSWESQPSLSADGRTLYFVSDRKGGKGARDIWKTEWVDENSWSKPINLGDSINTIYDEVSPFIHYNNQWLFFSSNGWPGFGGYDIFLSERKKQEWATPHNLGKPLNDPSDQLSLYITADGSKGYYSNEPAGSMGAGSRLYVFDIPKELIPGKPAVYVYGKITDKSTGNPLFASVQLFNLKEEKPVYTVNSDEISGDFLMVLPQGAQYALYVNSEGYLFNSTSFDYSEQEDLTPIHQNVELEPIRKGNRVILNNLFFELDSYQLLDQSLVELKEVLRFMNNNKTSKIKITGHTDNTGSVDYNKRLSEQRAKAVVDYLIQQGVDKSRLLFEGMGATQPITDNSTEISRRKNRRIEFEVM